MIYVTVGTTHFNKLIQKLDDLASPKHNILNGEEIICQIGNGNYIPKYTKYFRYDPNHWRYTNTAKLVITHGGASVLYLIREKIPFIAVANKELQDDHQTSFLSALSKICSLVWTDDLNKLPELIKHPPSSATVSSPPIGDYILKEAYKSVSK